MIYKKLSLDLKASKNLFQLNLTLTGCFQAIAAGEINLETTDAIHNAMLSGRRARPQLETVRSFITPASYTYTSNGHVCGFIKQLNVD